MNIANMGIDLDQVADLTTQVATSGALRSTELAGDPVFEMTIGIVVIVHAV